MSEKGATLRLCLVDGQKQVEATLSMQVYNDALTKGAVLEEIVDTMKNCIKHSVWIGEFKQVSTIQK